MANEFLSVMYDMDYYNLTTNFTKVATDFIQTNYNPHYSQLCLLLITLYSVLKIRNLEICVQELSERQNYLEQRLEDTTSSEDETDVDENETTNIQDRMTDLENAVKNLNSCVSTILIDSIDSINGNENENEDEEGVNGENRYETKYEQKDEDYVPESVSEDEE